MIEERKEAEGELLIDGGQEPARLSEPKSKRAISLKCGQRKKKGPHSLSW